MIESVEVWLFAADQPREAQDNWSRRGQIQYWWCENATITTCRVSVEHEKAKFNLDSCPATPSKAGSPRRMVGMTRGVVREGNPGTIALIVIHVPIALYRRGTGLETSAEYAGRIQPD